MNYTFADFLPAIPEIFVLMMICFILLVDLYIAKNRQIICYLLTQTTLIGACILTAMLYKYIPVISFAHSFVLDDLAFALKFFIYGSCFFVFLYSRGYISERNIPTGEYYVLSLFAVLGMMVLVSAQSLLTLFLGLEILSLPLYALVAIHRDSAMCSEAAMKYFVMGALASGMLLYGMSMIYGATQSIDVDTIANVLSSVALSQHLILIIGVVFVVVGLIFKFGAVPFHMWVPDVYQGAPTSVTLLIGSAPKIAALGMTLRLLIHAMPALSVQWQELLIVVAILSMLLGNIVAIIQKNIKRMLAYSAISHMGYMCLGLIALDTEGYSAAMFYILAYVIMSIGAFGMIILLSKNGFEAELIDDFRGLNSRSPWLAFLMLLLMFSMAGIPPTVGFFAKFGVLQALVNAHFTWLAVLALIFAVIGAYYYIYVIKVMYFEVPKQNTPIKTSWDMQLAISVNGLLMLGLGLFPGVLFGICRAVFAI